MRDDNFAFAMICGSCVLGPVAGLIVGSQSRDDARCIADWSFGIFLTLLVLDGGRFVAGGTDGPGLFILFTALIVGVGVGYRVASARPAAPKPARRDDDGGKPGPWDDDLA